MSNHSLDLLLTRGVTNIIDAHHLNTRLSQGTPLRIKLGIDPTGPQIHIGRAMLLWKLRAFQELGHQVVLIVGDFTAQVGDASDKTSERPMLSQKDVQKNLQGYLNQLEKILDLSQCEIHYNSEWLENLTFREISELAGIFSVSEMLDRDNFSQRHQAQERISLHEFMYPLMQGYDSVMVKADVEIGGNDQYFNLMAGRKIQKHYRQEPQDIITFEFLVGLDGRKMSTSWGNGIFITDEPQEMFGKIMTLKDELILDYFRLATDETLDAIEQYRVELAAGVNPRDIKIELGKAIVRRYYSDTEADYVAEEFIRIFAEKSIPEDISEMTISLTDIDYKPVQLVAQAFGVSKTEARRLLQDGGVKIAQGEPLRLDSNLDSLRDEAVVFQKGKRHFIRIYITA